MESNDTHTTIQLVAIDIVYEDILNRYGLVAYERAVDAEGLLALADTMNNITGATTEAALALTRVDADGE